MNILKDPITWVLLGEVIAIVGGVTVYVAAMTRQ
jgi:hypothetical protein